MIRAYQDDEGEDGVRNRNINQRILTTAFDGHEVVDG